MFIKIYKTIGFTILLALSSIAVKAHTEKLIEISGSVLTAKEKQHLLGVSVYLPELKSGTVTDANGHFTFQIKDNNSTLLIQISYVGYKTQLIRLNPSEWNTELEILLEEENIMTNEVIVSAGRIASRDEIAVLVDRMDSRSMRKSGETNSMSALVAIPGVEQIAYGTGIGKPVIRGMSFSRILSMYQGSRFENQQWGADHGLGVNDLGIEAVEVIKGPASFLYGSGAVGGVVYLVDERPAPKGRFLADVNSTFHSNTLGFRQTLGIRENKDSGWFYGFNAAYENHADYKDGNTRTIGNSRFNTYTLRANAGLQKDWGMLKVAYTFHQQKLGIIDDNELDESLATYRSDRTKQLPFQDIQDHLITLQSIVQLGKGRLESTLGHHLNYRLEIEEDFELVDLGLIQNNSTLDIKYFLDLGGVEHIFGTQGFYLSNTNGADVQEILIPDARILDASLYYLATFRKEKTTYQAGLRFDRRNTTGDATAPVIIDYGYQLPMLPSDQGVFSTQHQGFSGSLGLIYRHSPSFNFKTNLSSGFRAPDLAELFSSGSHPGTQRIELGNVNMKREQNLQWDVAMQYHKPNLKVEISPYANYISNYIYFTPTGNQLEGSDLIIWQFDQSNAFLYGGEAYVKWQPLGNKLLALETAYSNVRGINTSTANYMPLMPADRLNSSIITQLPSVHFLTNNYLSVRHQWVMDQNRLSPTEMAAYQMDFTPAFHLFGIAAGSRLQLGKQAMDIDLGVNNLFNAAYFDHLSFLRPYEINNMGRNISINISLPIEYSKN